MLYTFISKFPFGNSEMTNILQHWEISLKGLQLAEVFYDANYRSTIITSKNTSKNLSFCCFPDKKCIKMPILWKHRVCLVFFTEILWQTFWRNYLVILFLRFKNTALRTPELLGTLGPGNTRAPQLFTNTQSICLMSSSKV